MFESLPECAQYCYIESAKDSPCRYSRDRYCLCGGSERDRLLDATHTRAVRYCESKAPEMQVLIAEWLDFICEPMSGIYYSGR